MVAPKLTNIEISTMSLAPKLSDIWGGASE